jgi:hypothetical protein
LEVAKRAPLEDGDTTMREILAVAAGLPTQAFKGDALDVSPYLAGGASVQSHPKLLQRERYSWSFLESVIGDWSETMPVLLVEAEREHPVRLKAVWRRQWAPARQRGSRGRGGAFVALSRLVARGAAPTSELEGAGWEDGQGSNWRQLKRELKSCLAACGHHASLWAAGADPGQNVLSDQVVLVLVEHPE